MARSQPDTVDTNLLNKLTAACHVDDKCRFAVVVNTERPDVMATFEAAFDQGVRGTIVGNAMRDLGMSPVNEKTISRHALKRCQCFDKAGKQ